MNRVLLTRSIRDSWPLLVSCCLLLAGFVCLRIWIASRIKADALVRLFSSGLQAFSDLLPVPIEDLASPLGRSAFGFEELPAIVLLGLWTVTRGSECLVGRIGAGTMEMLLAQPVRRVSVVASHTAVTLAGVLILGAAGWLGTAAGLRVSSFDAPPMAFQLAPAIVNFVGLGVFLLGAATFVSAVARTRSQAVAIVIGAYVIELALMIVSRLSPGAKWLGRLTFLSAYEPTSLTLGMARDSQQHWPVFWQYNLWLFGLGAALMTAATVYFCRRDVPAPL